MKFIRKEDRVLRLTNYAGDATITHDDNTEENVKLLTSATYQPIIQFENGDSFTLDWEDILNLATKERDKVRGIYDEN